MTDDQAAGQDDALGYGEAVDAVRSFLDAFSSVAMNAFTAERIVADLRALTARLSPDVAAWEAEAESRRCLPARGRAMVPPFHIVAATPLELRGTVTFGRHFVGRNGAVHGGAIAMLFDEICGLLVNQPGMPLARTAYLNTSYRQVTPVDERLAVRAVVTASERRKRFVTIELTHGGICCADASALLIVLNPGQP